jgi:hypothetical protein
MPSRWVNLGRELYRNGLAVDQRRLYSSKSGPPHVRADTGSGSLRLKP